MGATVFREADRIRRHAPDTLFYWFLISAGYKTWRYLPTFFVAYTPHPDLHQSPFDRQVVQTLAAKKFGDDYHADAGIVRFRRANPLRPGVGVTDGDSVPPRRILHPDDPDRQGDDCIRFPSPVRTDAGRLRF